MKDTYSYEMLPQWGIKELTAADIDVVGGFVSLPKSGFFICRKGTITIGDHNRLYTIVPGDMIIYPIKAVVFIKEYSPDISGTIGITDLEEVMEIASKSVEASQTLDIMANPHISLTDDELEKIDEIAAIIMRRTGLGEKESQPLAFLWNAMCYEIAEIYRKKCAGAKVTKDRQSEIMLKFMFSLREHIKEEREVSFYAKEQCLSTRYFSSIVKDKTGMRPLDIISKAALKEVLELLEDPSLTVKEISYMMNFPTPSFFIRWFKCRQGVTPTAYRKGMTATQTNR